MKYIIRYHGLKWRIISLFSKLLNKNNMPIIPTNNYSLKFFIEILCNCLLFENATTNTIWFFFFSILVCDVIRLIWVPIFFQFIFTFNLRSYFWYANNKWFTWLSERIILEGERAMNYIVKKCIFFFFILMFFFVFFPFSYRFYSNEPHFIFVHMVCANAWV